MAFSKFSQRASLLRRVGRIPRDLARASLEVCDATLKSGRRMISDSKNIFPAHPRRRLIEENRLNDSFATESCGRATAEGSSTKTASRFSKLPIGKEFVRSEETAMDKLPPEVRTIQSRCSF